MGYDAYVQRASSKTEIGTRLAGMGTALPRGAFFLVSESTGLPISPVLEFFRDTCLAIPKGKTKRISPNTYEAKAYDMKDFVDAMDAYGKDLMQVSLNDLDQYVDSMIYEVSPTTGEPYADRTIKRRMDTVRSFYAWAQNKGLTKHKFDVDAMHPGRRTDYPDDKLAPEVWEPDGVDSDRDVEAIEIPHLTEIMRAIGPFPKVPGVENEEDASTGRPRDRLKFECCLQAGLRRAEVVHLSVLKLTEAASNVREPLQKYPLRVWGKGRKWRRVMTPGWLLTALVDYVKGERAELISRRKQLDPTFVDHGRVFVRSSGGKRTLADALNPKSMNAVFRAALRSLNLVKKTQSGRIVPKYRGHAVRHTYAVLEYFARKAQGDHEPWVYIQRQLGHKYVETTKAIYLRVVQEHEVTAGTLLSRILRRQVFGYGEDR